MKFSNIRRFTGRALMVVTSIFIAFSLFAIPVMSVYAAAGTGSGGAGTGSGGAGTGSGGAGTGSGGVRLDTKINNPLGDNIKDIPTFIQTIIGIVLVIGVPIVTLAIIYSGYLFVVARGVPEELSRAKKNLTYTLIGAALLFGAFVISKAIKGTVDQIIRENK